MGLTKFAIKLAVPIPKIESFERFLFVGPHPDDIEIGCGATIKKLVDLGKEICFLICTDGRFGDGAAPKNITREELIEMRKKESIASAKYLGVNDVRFLNLKDGGFYEFNDMVKGVAKVAGEFKPDIIFGPDYFVSSESHIDHLNTGNAVRMVGFAGPYEGIMNEYGADKAPVKAIAYYFTAHPNRLVKTNGLKKQLESLKLHVSQYPEGNQEYASICTYLKIRNIEYSIKSLHFGAEGFRVLGPTHMHCLSESGQ